MKVIVYLTLHLKDLAKITTEEKSVRKDENGDVVIDPNDTDHLFTVAECALELLRQQQIGPDTDLLSAQGGVLSNHFGTKADGCRLAAESICAILDRFVEEGIVQALPGDPGGPDTFTVQHFIDGIRSLIPADARQSVA